MLAAEVYQACRAALSEAGTPLPRRAQASGDAHTDVDDDIARYIMGAAVMNFASEQQRQRMLEVLFDGLRAR